MKKSNKNLSNKDIETYFAFYGPETIELCSKISNCLEGHNLAACVIASGITFIDTCKLMVAYEYAPSILHSLMNIYRDMEKYSKKQEKKEKKENQPKKSSKKQTKK